MSDLYLSMGLSGLAPSGNSYPSLSTVAAHSLVQRGDVSRLRRVFAKAKRGERLVIGVIGGSITEGAHAGKAELRWGDQMSAWWSGTFPGCEVARVNAGIGATGTLLAVHRAHQQLLKHGPDVVGIEFSVNDPAGTDAVERMEGLVRQSLNSEKSPAVFMLHMSTESGGNSQEDHIKVAHHYGLPSISYRDGMWSEIRAGRLTWGDISPDEVHPNAIGHTYAAGLVNHFLQCEYEKWLADGCPEGGVSVVSAPLRGTDFDNGRVLDLKDVPVLVNEGFEAAEYRRWGRGWCCKHAGSRIAFEVEGAVVGVLFWRIHGPMGRGVLRVDGEEVGVMEGWFEKTWGGYTPYQLAVRGKPGRHVVEIEVLEEHHPESEGYEFQIHSLMTCE